MKDTMDKDHVTLLEYFDHALRELYSMEEMLDAFGQHQTADVLRSVVEMAFAKLSDAGCVIERDIGQILVHLNEHGEPLCANLAAKPLDESLQ